jgi:hypothetical protein
MDPTDKNAISPATICRLDLSKASLPKILPDRQREPGAPQLPKGEAEILRTMPISASDLDGKDS